MHGTLRQGGWRHQRLALVQQQIWRKREPGDERQTKPVLVFLPLCLWRPENGSTSCQYNDQDELVVSKQDDSNGVDVTTVHADELSCTICVHVWAGLESHLFWFQVHINNLLAYHSKHLTMKSNTSHIAQTTVTELCHVTNMNNYTSPLRDACYYQRWSTPVCCWGDWSLQHWSVQTNSGAERVTICWNKAVIIQSSLSLPNAVLVKIEPCVSMYNSHPINTWGITNQHSAV